MSKYPYWYNKDEEKKDTLRSAPDKNTDKSNPRGLSEAASPPRGRGDSTPSIGDNSFYAGQENYGIISAKPAKPKYLHEFRNEIAGYDDKLSKLHDEQYRVMVYEQDGKKLDSLAQTQANLEKEKAALEDDYYSAMGIGSESKSGSENEGNNPNFSYNNWYPVYERDKDNMLPDKGFNWDNGDKEITLPNGKKGTFMPDKGFSMDWGDKEITLPNGKKGTFMPDKGFSMDWGDKEITLPNGKKGTFMPDKGFNWDKGNNTITFNGKTYEVAPNGEAREIPNTKPSGIMEERNTKPDNMLLIERYPKGQLPFDEGNFEGKGISQLPYKIDPNKKPEDMSQYLMAANSTVSEPGLDGEGEKKDNKTSENSVEDYQKKIEELLKEKKLREDFINGYKEAIEKNADNEELCAIWEKSIANNLKKIFDINKGIIDYGSEIASINAREENDATGEFSGGGGGGGSAGGSWGEPEEIEEREDELGWKADKEAEEKRLLETPISELTAEEQERRKELEKEIELKESINKVVDPLPENHRETITSMINDVGIDNVSAYNDGGIVLIDGGDTALIALSPKEGKDFLYTIKKATNIQGIIGGSAAAAGTVGTAVTGALATNPAGWTIIGAGGAILGVSALVINQIINDIEYNNDLDKGIVLVIDKKTGIVSTPKLKD